MKLIKIKAGYEYYINPDYIVLLRKDQDNYLLKTVEQTYIIDEDTFNKLIKNYHE